MNRNQIVLWTCVIFMFSCAPMKTIHMTKIYPSLPDTEEVVVIAAGETIPFQYEELGTIKLGDGGITTKCNYNDLLSIAIKEARKAGGNAIKVVENIPPHFERYGLGLTYTNCHTIFVMILRKT